MKEREKKKYRVGRAVSKSALHEAPGSLAPGNRLPIWAVLHATPCGYTTGNSATMTPDDGCPNLNGTVRKLERREINHHSRTLLISLPPVFNTIVILIHSSVLNNIDLLLTRSLPIYRKYRLGLQHSYYCIYK